MKTSALLTLGGPPVTILGAGGLTLACVGLASVGTVPLSVGLVVLVLFLLGRWYGERLLCLATGDELRTFARAAREREAHLRALVDNIPDTIHAKDLAARFTLINRSLAERLRCPEEDVLGKTVGEVFPPHLAQRYLADDRQVLRTGEPIINREEPGYDADGNPRWVLTNKSPVRDPRTGDVVGLVAVSRDITDRKRMQEALSQSEANYRALVEDNPALISRFRGDGTMTFVNETLCRYFQTSREHLLGRSFVPLVPAEEQPKIANLLAALRPGMPAYTHEIRLPRPNGQTAWMRWTNRAIHDEQGQFLEYQSVGMDVTERKEAEEVLREQQHFMERVTSLLPVYLYVFDLERDRSVYANRSALHFLGYTSPEIETLSSTPLSALMHPEDLPRFTEHANRLRQAADFEVCEFEYRMRQAGGEWRWNLSRDMPFQRRPDGTVREIVGAAWDITERKQAEEALRSSEQRLLDIASHLPGVIFQGVLRPDGTLTVPFVSEGIRSLVHFSPREFTAEGGDPFRFLFEEDIPGILSHIGESATQLTTFHHECRVRTRRGEIRWLRVSATPARDPDGTTIWNGVALDITEHRLAETALRDSQRFISAITEASPLIIYVFDILENRNIYANRQIARDLGYSPEDIQQMGADFFPRLLHPDDLERIPELLARWETAADGDCFETHYRMKHQDGAWRWFLGRDVVFQRDADGRVRQIVGTAQDHTARLLAEQALRASEEKFRTVVQTMPDFLVTVDRDGRMDFINRIVPERDPATVVGTTIYEHMPPETHEQARQALAQVFATGKMSGFETPGQIGPDEWRWFSVRCAPIRHDDAIVGALLIAADITDRRRAEEQLRTSLDEKEALLREVHHRVKNNLQIISSLLNLQAAHVKEPAILDIFREIQNRIRSMALIHECLYASDKLARIDFGLHIERLCAHLFRTYGIDPAQVALSVQVQPVALGIDQAVPCGLLVNELVSNALKYAFPEGRQGQVAIGFRVQSDGTGELTIRDDGIGLPSEKALAQAPSLGLQLVAGFIKQLEGTLTIRREGGTMVRVTFPIQDTQE